MCENTRHHNFKYIGYAPVMASTYKGGGMLMHGEKIHEIDNVEMTLNRNNGNFIHFNWQ